MALGDVCCHPTYYEVLAKRESAVLEQFSVFATDALGGRKPLVHFDMNLHHYLVADGPVVFKYEPVSESFHEFQSVATGGGDTAHFQIAGRHFLATTSTKIYEFNSASTSFVEFGSLGTSGEYIPTVEHFKIAGCTFLAFAHYSKDGNYNLNSKIYEFNAATDAFVHFQSIGIMFS